MIERIAWADNPHTVGACIDYFEAWARERRPLDEAFFHHMAGFMHAWWRPLAPAGLLQLLVDGGLADSLSTARRKVKEGSVTVNGARVADDRHTVQPADLVAGRWLLLGKGKSDRVIFGFWPETVCVAGLEPASSPPPAE